MGKRRVMRFRVAITGYAAAAIVVAALSLANAQNSTSGVGGEIAPGIRGIGLTAPQKRLICGSTSTQPMVRAPEGERFDVGSTIPDAIMLNEMPIHVKDEIGVLRDYKFATLPDAQAVLIVDPANRKIMEIVR